MEGVEKMGKNIDKDRQNKTVLFDALKNHLSNRGHSLYESVN